MFENLVIENSLEIQNSKLYYYMLELFAIIILFIGLIGMGIIMARKLPVLAELSTEKIGGLGSLEGIKRKVKKLNLLKVSFGEILLQKTLSKIRVLTLKTDSKTSAWLSKLRQRSIKKKESFSDDYWKKIRRKK